MPHYTYRITHIDTGLFYEGVRTSSEDPHKDRYMGSGANIVKAIKLLGREAFTKEVLAVYETRELADKAERRLVNRAKLEDPLCMNLQLGGSGNGTVLTGEKLQAHFFEVAVKAMIAAGWTPGTKKYPVFKSRWEWLSRFLSDEVRAKNFVLVHYPAKLISRIHLEELAAAR